MRLFLSTRALAASRRICGLAAPVATPVQGLALVFLAEDGAPPGLPLT